MRAEFGGVLSEVHVQPGKYVRVGDPLVKLTNTAIVEIPVPIAWDEYHRLEPLIRTAKTLEDKPLAYVGESIDRPHLWTGRVVRAAPTADPLTRTVKVFVRVDNSAVTRSEEFLRPVIPGMHYYASIVGRELEDVLAVPRDAIVEGRVFVAVKLRKTTMKIDGKDRDVWEGIAEARKVEIVRRVQTLAVVRSGVKPGDHVILTNLDVIHDGAKVRFDGRRIRRLQEERRPPAKRTTP